MQGGDAGWRAALADVLNELTTLVGIKFQYAEYSNALSVEFLPHATIPCQDARVDYEIWGCAYVSLNDLAVSQDDYLLGGRVEIAAGGDKAASIQRHLLRHELLHALFGFVHAPAGVMKVPFEQPYGYTAQDKEMLTLYGALPNGLWLDDIRERACIGSDGNCESPYDGAGVIGLVRQ